MTKKLNEKLFSRIDSSSFFSTMERVIDSGLIFLDSDLHSLFANDKAKMIFNIKPEEKFTDEDEIRLLGPLLNELQASGGDLVEKELRVNLPGIEDERIVRTMSTAIAGSDGKLGYIVCLWNITSVREKEKLQSEFVSHVSHEMRTPLTVMKEFTAILLDGLGGEVNSTQKEYLGIIHNNVERLNRIVGTLLDISRLEAGKVKLAREIANVKRLINQIVYMLGPHAEKKKIKLTCKSLRNLPPARIDVDKITQVLINLVENAFKHTPEGGRIKIGAKRVDSYISVSVSDTGVGIPLEDKERIFDKFYQIGLKPGPGAKGVGLGLAITKQIVLMHGGKIRVDSIPGKGSTFTFTVPTVGKIKDLSSYVSECVDFSRLSGKHFTLLRITITNIKELAKNGVSREVIRTMKEIIENELRKATDSDPFFVNDGFFIGLPNTSKKRAGILSERLLSAFSFKFHVGLKVRLASYPEDAGTAEEIIKHCTKED